MLACSMHCEILWRFTSQKSAKFNADIPRRRVTLLAPALYDILSTILNQITLYNIWLLEHKILCFCPQVGSAHPHRDTLVRKLARLKRLRSTAYLFIFILKKSINSAFLTLECFQLRDCCIQSRTNFSYFEFNLHKFALNFKCIEATNRWCMEICRI